MDKWKITPGVVENENTIIRNKGNSFPNFESSHLPMVGSI